jgi:hypothetical protein
MVFMRNGAVVLLCIGFSMLKITTVQAEYPLPEFTLPSPAKGATAPLIDKLKTKNWVRPPHPSLVGRSPTEFALQSTAGSTIPLWTGSDNGYTFQMVGLDPSVPHSTQVTNIKAQLVPVQITFYGSQTIVFDPTKKDICSPNGSPLAMVQHSPIFNNISLPGVSSSLGTAQFTSLFQRANFFKYTGPTGVNPRYEVTLTPKTLPTVKISTYFGDLPVPRKCDPLGLIDISALDYAIIHGIIPTLARSGVGPTTLPIFLLNNVVMFDGVPSNCCILGYHQAFISGTSGALQTFVVANYDTSGFFTEAQDITPLSHEIAEWMDDPTLVNPTPPWGHIGQVAGCQNNLEVADPLTGTSFPIPMLNFTYHVQDLAFKSWFYGDAPSIGVNGWHSLFGTFRSPAQPCF